LILSRNQARLNRSSVRRARRGQQPLRRHPTRPDNPLQPAGPLGSPTQTPPSACKALPSVDEKPRLHQNRTSRAAKPVADVARPHMCRTASHRRGACRRPFRAASSALFARCKNEGINIKGTPGAAVQAADSGYVRSESPKAPKACRISVRESATGI